MEKLRQWSVRLEPRQIAWLEKQAKRENTDKAKILRGIIDTRMKFTRLTEKKIEIGLFEGERKYLNIISASLGGLPVDMVIHLALLLLWRLDIGLGKLFDFRKEVVKGLLEKSSFFEEGEVK